jgi:hypothetical protein
MRPTLPALAALVMTAAPATLLVAAAPAAAKPVDHDVPAAFARVLPGVKARTRLPVLLPDRMPYERGKLYASGSGRRRAWSLSLAAAPGCGGATACFVAEFSARKGARPYGRRTVRLRGGRTGRFQPLSCGASCAPPSISWRQHHAAYVIQAAVGTQRTERRILVRMANQAIRAGAR